MIRCKTSVVPNSRAATGSAWLATTEINGRMFDAVSRHGAPNALARVLLAAGVPDHDVEVFDADRDRISLRYRSMHEMAKWTYSESAGKPLRRVRFEVRPQDAFSVPGEPPK
jgi:hypothetical protein